MTIKFENEALLVAIQTHTWPSSSIKHNDIGDNIVHGKGVQCCHSSDRRVNIFRSLEHVGVATQDSVCSVQLQHQLKENDDDSVFSSSTSTTASLSDLESDIDFTDRRITFADTIVTDVWTRPFTPKDDIGLLYYSNEETRRFRQEYRIERKLLSSLTADFSADPDTFDKEELSTLLVSAFPTSSSSSSTSSCTTRSRTGISQVVVLHNDKLEAFCANGTTAKCSSANTLSSVSTSSLSTESVATSSVASVSNDFFDTPEFWSGSITWW